MFINTDPEGAYWFHSDQIRTIEEKYQARYLGHWCVKQSQDEWSDDPVDVFYQPHPDTSLGHGHYFGMFVRDNSICITNAESAFSEPITGILLKSGEVMVSRYRHDYQYREGAMIDGGRDYVRTHKNAQTVTVIMEHGEFKFELDYEYA